MCLLELSEGLVECILLTSNLGLSSQVLDNVIIIKYNFFSAGALRYSVSFMNPMRTSLVSKLIPLNEMGKVFSITMFVTFVFGLTSDPIYTIIYNNTIHIDPGIYNFVTAGFHGLSIIIVL